MSPHSSTLTWKIPWAQEPGRLQSMGSWRVRHDWVTSLSLFTFMHWRKKWQPTPIFLPGESQGRGSRTRLKRLSSSSSSSSNINKTCVRVGYDWATNTYWTSLAQPVNNLLAMQETQVQFLGGEDPLEKGMATHFSSLTWRIPLTEEPSGLQPMGSQRAEHDWVTNTSTSSLFFYCLNALIDSQFMLEFSY